MVRAFVGAALGWQGPWESSGNCMDALNRTQGPHRSGVELFSLLYWVMMETQRRLDQLTQRQVKYYGSVFTMNHGLFFRFQPITFHPAVGAGAENDPFGPSEMDVPCRSKTVGCVQGHMVQGYPCSPSPLGFLVQSANRRRCRETGAGRGRGDAVSYSSPALG